jgi:predicted small lipoprotein YifL
VTCARQFRPALPLLAIVTVLSCGLAGCGKKGPPRLPLALAPARIDDLVVRRLGDEVQLQFTVPVKNTDATTPADITAVDVLAMTGDLVDASGRPLGDAEFVAAAGLVRTLAIEPPPPPPEKEKKGAGQAAPQPAPVPRGPGQGDRATVVERLTPEVLAVTPRPGGSPTGGRPDLTLPAPETAEPIGPVWGPVERVPERHYAVAGRSRRGKLGPLSRRVAIPLGTLPPAPGAPQVTYDEQRLTGSWAEPAGGRRPVQEAAAEGLLEARALLPGSAAHTYNVYAVSEAGALAAAPWIPANPSASSVPRLDAGAVVFGEERCFLVRTVEQHGPDSVESMASPVTCVTPRDTFPPAPPRNLAAVGAEGAINLIWEASGASDLAGYLVLRAETTGGAPQAVTPEPVRETTFRDTGVKAGVRYVYVVVALDTAQPPNRSAESNRVEETAR